ncbi:hypothetical protein FNYG_15043 [Fusarium nygamai]|uniref:Uncharacterized protein n=1 Tax=Gibberella nygamai TaxID=42673 RepID=A0A2K0UKT7_GIBNY|nr:hypothetical protein FNYG_15043 [Fusarium nygamai]
MPEEALDALRKTYAAGVWVVATGTGPKLFHG